MSETRPNSPTHDPRAALATVAEQPEVLRFKNYHASVTELARRVDEAQVDGSDMVEKALSRDMAACLAMFQPVAHTMVSNDALVLYVTHSEEGQRMISETHIAVEKLCAFMAKLCTSAAAAAAKKR